MYSELGEKVKLLRNRRGVKQDDLGEVLKLSRSQISNLESGRRNLSVKQLEKLCEYFKVDMSYFLMSETTDSCLDLIEKAAKQTEKNNNAIMGVLKLTYNKEGVTDGTMEEELEQAQSK